MKDDGSPLGGPGKIVESDEAFVGGSKKKRLSGKTAPMKKGRFTSRARRSRPLVPRCQYPRWHIVARRYRHQHRSPVHAHDGRRPFLLVDRARVRGGHGTVLHSNKQFSKGGGVHSNTAENFFSILKRGVIGTYHHWSRSTHAPLPCRVRFPLALV
jgi:hypothetical protein